MLQVVLSVPVQIQMKIGPRFQILLKGEGYRIALLNATTVSNHTENSALNRRLRTDDFPRQEAKKEARGS